MSRWRSRVARRRVRWREDVDMIAKTDDAERPNSSDDPDDVDAARSAQRMSVIRDGLVAEPRRQREVRRPGRQGDRTDLWTRRLAGSVVPQATSLVRDARRAVRRESLALAGVARAQADRRDALRARGGSTCATKKPITFLGSCGDLIGLSIGGSGQHVHVNTRWPDGLTRVPFVTRSRLIALHPLGLTMTIATMTLVTFATSPHTACIHRCAGW